MQRIVRATRSFHARGNSFVHTLVTNPERAGPDTYDVCEDRAGRWQHVRTDELPRTRAAARAGVRHRTRVRRRRIDAALAAAERRRENVDTHALDLVRRGGDELHAELQRNPVPPELWNALVRRPRRATAELLIELLVGSRTPQHTRHAVAAALRQMLDLVEPPIDPETGAPAHDRRIEDLRRRAAKLP